MCATVQGDTVRASRLSVVVAANRDRGPTLAAEGTAMDLDAPQMPDADWLLQGDAPTTGLSGDPLLKRLVDLAQIGFSAEMTLYSNGQVIHGTLISSQTYRQALAETLRSTEGMFASLDQLIAEAVEEDEPGESGLGSTSGLVPEPRFIHLAKATIGTDRRELAPFLRLRLPAVSGFWLSSLGGPDAAR